MTRGNRVRLRYSLGTMTGLCALAISLVGFTDFHGGLAMPQLVKKEANASLPQDIAAQDVATPAVMSPDITSRIAAALQKPVEAIKNIPYGPQQQTVEVGSGDTLAGLLQKTGVSGKEAYEAVKALSEHFDPRKVKAGQTIDLTLDPAGEGFALAEMTMKIDPITDVIISRQDKENFTAEIREKELHQQPAAAAAEIETSLYGSALRAGIPASVVAEVIRIYSWDVDFQRDIRQGDKIEVLYDSFTTDDGDFSRTGDVLYAQLTIGGKEIPVYRYETSDGRIDYFEPDGHSIRKALMRTPVDGARISSGFGMRHHPVLGYNKMHKGIDFAGPLGTPIYAAGDGTIEEAGRKGSYGNYVRIRHNGSIKTAYAHMHKFGKGISSGKRVRQGDVIGYIGATGRATGPHLHYEVLKSNKQVNPNSVDLPTGEQLAGKDMDRFKDLMRGFQRQYASLRNGLKLAHRGDGQETRTLR